MINEKKTINASRTNNQLVRRESSPMKWLLRFILKIYDESVSAIALAGYSPTTIADYFRKKGAQIGEDCEIQIDHLGTEPYLVSLGNHVLISMGAVLHTHDGGTWIFRDKDPDVRVYGTIIIEDNCIIGRNAHILPNVRIGKNSIVGAGSVVISDVPPNSIVMGVPARPISSMSKYEEKCFATWAEQRPTAQEMGKIRDLKHFRKNKKVFKRHLMNILWNQKKAEATNDGE
jgi:acetyltransferase-like isoleucine patch superfamily enzyme